MIIFALLGMTELFPGLSNEPTINDENLRLLSYLDGKDYFKQDFDDETKNYESKLKLLQIDNLEETDNLTNEKYIWNCDNCETAANIKMQNETIVCTRCGEIFEHLLDQGPEYRWFSGDDRNSDPTRVGAPQNPLLPESSLGTTILLRKNHGNAMRKIKRYHSRSIRRPI